MLISKYVLLYSLELFNKDTNTTCKIEFIKGIGLTYVLYSHNTMQTYRMTIFTVMLTVLLTPMYVSLYLSFRKTIVLIILIIIITIKMIIIIMILIIMMIIKMMSNDSDIDNNDRIMIMTTTMIIIIVLIMIILSCKGIHSNNLFTLLKSSYVHLYLT